VGPSDSAFGQLAATGAVLQIDDKSSVSGQVRRDFFSRFALKNTLAVPVFLKGKVIGFLGIGNNRDTFSYAKDDREFLEILEKQMAIAFENDSLVHRVGKLEIKDALTGLYNEAFITTRLEEEIKRAIIYQRPCSFILLNIDDYQEIGKRLGHQHAEAILKKIAYLIRDSVTEIDRVARISSNEFAIVLPERNKRQALYLAEGIRKKIEFDFSQRQEGKVTVSGG
jgi:diguanylate cyclase (GGDEF)-like protein